MALDILLWMKDNEHSISDLLFEILNREERKSGYTYVINDNKINILTVENHLIENGIDIQFQDKSTNEKKYLTVYKV